MPLYDFLPRDAVAARSLAWGDGGIFTSEEHQRCTATNLRSVAGALVGNRMPKERS